MLFPSVFCCSFAVAAKESLYCCYVGRTQTSLKAKNLFETSSRKTSEKYFTKTNGQKLKHKLKHIKIKMNSFARKNIYSQRKRKRKIKQTKIKAK
jgi:hypothetical protein